MSKFTFIFSLLSLFALTDAAGFTAGILMKYNKNEVGNVVNEKLQPISSKDFAQMIINVHSSKSAKANSNSDIYPTLYFLEHTIPVSSLESNMLSYFMNTSSSATLYSQIETKSKYRFNEELKNAFKTGEIDHESVKLFCENEGNKACRVMENALNVTGKNISDFVVSEVNPDSLICFTYNAPKKGKYYRTHMAQTREIINEVTSEISRVDVVYAGISEVEPIDNCMKLSPAILQGLVVFFFIAIGIGFAVWLSFCVQSPGDMDESDNIAQAIQAQKHHKEN